MSDKKMTDREILEKMLKDGGCVVRSDECPLRKLIGKCDCFSAILFNKRIKSRLAEMDEAECAVPELKGVKMLVSANKEYWKKAYVYGKVSGSTRPFITAFRSYEFAKPLPTTKTAEDLRDHTLGEVMELGYVVTIEEKSD